MMSKINYNVNKNKDKRRYCNSIFINNSAEGMGRAIYTEVDLRVERSMFFEVSFDTSGPVSTASKKYEIVDCKFENYAADEDLL